MALKQRLTDLNTAIADKLNTLDTNIQGVIQDKNYVYIQATATNNWTINHGLNKRPSITVLDQNGNEVNCKKNYIDDNQVMLSFNTPFLGSAIFN